MNINKCMLKPFEIEYIENDLQDLVRLLLSLDAEICVV